MHLNRRQLVAASAATAAVSLIPGGALAVPLKPDLEVFTDRMLIMSIIGTQCTMGLTANRIIVRHRTNGAILPSTVEVELPGEMPADSHNAFLADYRRSTCQIWIGGGHGTVFERGRVFVHQTGHNGRIERFYISKIGEEA